MDKYADLKKELVRALTERLLDIEYDLAKRNCFLFDVEIDHHIFDLLSDHLWHKTAFAETISELMKSEADSDVFADLDLFLKWFCASVAAELNLEENIDTYWQGVLGSKNKCTKYFQRYLLAAFDTPIVLGLDDLDLIFQYPKIASDFFGLLRAWHEKAKNEAVWKKLRLRLARIAW